MYNKARTIVHLNKYSTETSLAASNWSHDFLNNFWTIFWKFLNKIKAKILTFSTNSAKICSLFNVRTVIFTIHLNEV